MKEKAANKDESGQQHAVTYTCTTDGCLNGVGVQNYEVVTYIEADDILETMTCGTCGGVMKKTEYRPAGGAKFEIWT